MGPYLWFVLILSVLALLYQHYLFGAARRAKSHDPKILGVGALLFVLATLWLLASFTFYHSDDLRKRVTRLEYLGSRVQLPAESEPGKLRIQISGGQIGPVVHTSELRTRGDQWITRSIWWDALKSGTKLDLDLSQAGETVSSVGARTSSQDQIIRINGFAVNTPSLGWVGPGQSMTFYLTPQSRRSNKNLGGFTVSVRAGSVSVDWRSPRDEVIEADRAVPLRDSRTLWNVVSTAGSAKIFQGLADSAAAAHVSTAVVRSFLERCVLVRRGPVGQASGRKGLTSFFRAAEGPVDSPVGLLWPELAPDQPLTLSGSVSGTSNFSEIPAQDGHYEVKISEPGSESGLEASLSGQSIKAADVQTDPKRDDNREYLDFRYEFPYRYHLPPESELQKSNGEFLLATQELGLSEPGYVLPSGNLDQVFTRRATIDKDRLKVTYVGADHLQVPVNTPHTLGDGVVAPLVQFASPLAERDSRSGWMLWSLILSAVLWCLSARHAWGVPPPVASGDKSSMKRYRWRPDPASWKLFAIQLGVWMMVTALLSVRAILAYRVTMDPPGSLAPVPAAGYEAAWRIAVDGFIAFQLLAPVISLSRKWWVWCMENRGQLLFTLSGVFAAIALLAALLWDLDHFIFRRFSTTSSLLQVAMLIALASLLLRGLAESHGRPADGIPPGKFWKILYSPWLLLPVPVLLVIAHPGYGLHIVALAPACAFVLLARGKKRAARVGLWLLGLGAAILVFLPLLSGAEAIVADRVERGGPAKTNPNFLDRTSNFITKPYQLLQDSDALYRTVATAPKMAESLLVAPDVHTGFRPQKILDSLQQRWQMRLNMSADGQGYFAAPLEDRGLSRGTMLSDGSYCTFLVGEHGIGAGWALTGCLCVLSLMLFYGALFWRRVGAWGQLAFIASAAGLFGFPAIYMSYASLWAVPFAGQNYPFLGLSSLTEITLYSGLALLAIGLFNVVPSQPQATGDSSSEAAEAPKPAAPKGPDWSVWYICYFRYLVLPITLSWLVLGGFYLWGRDSQVKERFHLDDTTFRALDQDAAAFNRERSSDSGPSGAGQPLSITRTAAYKAWGASVQTLAYDAEVGTGQTPFRLPEGLEGALEVDHTAFERNSPFSPEGELDWKGNLVSLGADPAPAMLVPGTGKSISLDRSHPAVSVKVQQDHVFVPSVSSSVDVRMTASDRSDSLEDYGSFFLDGNGDVEVSMSAAFHSGVVVLNGHRNPSPKTKMAPGDTLTVSNRSHSISFIYMGRQPEPFPCAYGEMGATDASSLRGTCSPSLRAFQIRLTALPRLPKSLPRRSSSA